MKEQITTREEVDYIRNRGHEPLMLWQVFDLPLALRLELIEELFPRYSVANNQRFYRWFWDNYPGERRCEECGAELFDYYSWHVSHILSRGHAPQYAYDPINCNLLCKGHHDRWGNPGHRTEMRIYASNQYRIVTYLNYKKR